MYIVSEVFDRADFNSVLDFMIECSPTPRPPTQIIMSENYWKVAHHKTVRTLVRLNFRSSMTFCFGVMPVMPGGGGLPQFSRIYCLKISNF